MKKVQTRMRRYVLHPMPFKFLKLEVSFKVAKISENNLTVIVVFKYRFDNLISISK